MKIVSQVILPQKYASPFQSSQNTAGARSEQLIARDCNSNFWNWTTEPKECWRVKLRDQPSLALVNWTQPRVSWEVGTTAEKKSPHNWIVCRPEGSFLICDWYGKFPPIVREAILRQVVLEYSDGRLNKSWGEEGASSPSGVPASFPASSSCPEFFPIMDCKMEL